MGLTIMPKAITTQATANQRVTNAMQSEIYDGKELHRNPGLTDARFEAYKLPSRMGDTLVYPKERK
jgi:hypothetical protein